MVAAGREEREEVEGPQASRTGTRLPEGANVAGTAGTIAPLSGVQTRAAAAAAATRVEWEDGEGREEEEEEERCECMHVCQGCRL